MNILKMASCGLALMIAGSATAEDVKMFTDRMPSAMEMGGILFSQPTASKSEAMKMRSISFSSSKSKPKELPELARQDQSASAVGLPIKFAFNSADVLNESKPFLNEIGKMLALPDYSNERLIIEGHTDATGPESYNQSLSEKRAQSVKAYLKGNFNIASNRLLVTGLGESQSLPQMSPYAAVNRRVQFRKAR
jgi:outer membrane protein OmpA-like peptidoglycan-associated protein